jgi:hypothetical protein
MLKRREDVPVMKSRRVHGDPKKKILLSTDEDEHESLESRSRGLEVKTWRHDCQKNPQPEQDQAKPPHPQGRSKQ